MRPDNLPAFAMRLVVVKGMTHSPTTCRLQVMLSNGEWHTLDRWNWDAGRPSHDQMADIVNSLGTHASQEIIGIFGVQGVLAT